MDLQVKSNPIVYISNEENNDWDSKQNQRDRGPQCYLPKCDETFGVEFNLAIDGSFYHAIRNDRTKIRAMSTIHMRSERNLKCPYCGYKFVEKRE